MNSAQRLKELKLSCGWSRDRFILGVELLYKIGGNTYINSILVRTQKYSGSSSLPHLVSPKVFLLRFSITLYTRPRIEIKFTKLPLN